MTSPINALGGGMSPRKLKAIIKEFPAERAERIPGLHYRCLTTAKPNVWAFYIKMCKELGQDYAKMYLEQQGWDVDWEYNYHLELQSRANAGRSLGTDHRTPAAEGQQDIDFKSIAAGNEEH